MKKLKYMILLLILIPISVFAVATTSSSIDYVKVYIFSSDNCKQCDEIRNWLKENKKDYPRISIEYMKDEELLNDVKDKLKIKNNELPLIVIGSDYFNGNTSYVKDEIINALKSYTNTNDSCDVVAKIKNDEDIKECLKINEGIYKEKNNSNNIWILFVAITIIIIGVISFILIKKKSESK